MHGKSILYTSENVIDYTKEAKKEWSNYSFMTSGSNTVNFVLFVYNLAAWGVGLVFGVFVGLFNMFIGGGNDDVNPNAQIGI